MSLPPARGGRRPAGFTVRRGVNDLRAGIAAVSARLEDGRVRVLEGRCPCGQNVAVHGRILPTARTSCVREWPTLRYEWEYRQEAAQVVSGSRLGLG
ncbi:MAG: hypothetical protein EXR98_20220 [Gemmataceae bacterium]|nr:hypothetical protein [Gemmataceae bacterium]